MFTSHARNFVRGNPSSKFGDDFAKISMCREFGWTFEEYDDADWVLTQKALILLHEETKASK